MIRRAVARSRRGQIVLEGERDSDFARRSTFVSGAQLHGTLRARWCAHMRAGELGGQALDVAARPANDDAPAQRGRAGVYGGVVRGSTAREPCRPRLGHQVESKVPGRCTGGISRTVGRV